MPELEELKLTELNREMINILIDKLELSEFQKFTFSNEILSLSLKSLIDYFDL